LDEMQNLMKGRTTLIIAHRQTTIQNAGKVMYSTEGRLLAQERTRNCLNHVSCMEI
jgi:ABC-type multidrug transport system fused ATPase/permease subunit